MKRGYLERHVDVSGVSGTGKVAELCVASDGRVAVFWPEPNDSVAVWSSLEKVREVHGHQGNTEIVILDDPELEDVPHCHICHSPHHCIGHDFGCPGCLAGVS